MKLAYSGALLLLVFFPALRQGDQPASLCRIETKYDRSTDTTTLQCNLIELGKGAPKLIVQANASFRGKGPKETAKFWFGLSSYRGGATRHTQRLFQEATTLYLAIDSERLEIPVIDYHTDFYELNQLLAESARAEINREDLRRLLDARSLEGKWGDVDFKLSGAALSSLKGFIYNQVFAANGR
jgi:hypothetical protein